MTRGIRVLAPVTALAAAIFAGCAIGASRAAPAKTVETQVQAPESGPRLLTDLSSLSPGPPLESVGERIIGSREIAGAGRAAPIRRSAQSSGAVFRVGDDRHPGEEHFLNEKAARFDMLSVRVMNQLFAAMQELEESEEGARLKVADGLRPVLITGTLNKDGRLGTLVLEQHSGQAKVDQMAIRACKRALYINNPPPEAMTSAGDYRIRIEARIENYASTDEEHWVFKTYIGIALL